MPCAWRDLFFGRDPWLCNCYWWSSVVNNSNRNKQQSAIAHNACQDFSFLLRTRVFSAGTPLTVPVTYLTLLHIAIVVASQAIERRRRSADTCDCGSFPGRSFGRPGSPRPRLRRTVGHHWR